ncbi:hypothetical protein PR003_g7259 [Phytophthora rubi]|uniref:Uncharacterized protein n=1 Tax=Phytophthora rubi TaxID=129364 RepID=A0A6A3MRL5_9STRA|nr:hypothetical protein PR002_g7408 [Phytophthora rubi]KAE9346770.1 hypothetical protein PR003_g7259 [Phytophthora rubi]
MEAPWRPSQRSRVQKKKTRPVEELQWPQQRCQAGRGSARVRGVDNELVAFRFKARKESQMEHTVREKELYEEQANTTHVLFIDLLRDHSVRSTEDDTHMNTKAKLTRCTDSFQTDMTQWISDMTPWFKHHAVWLGVHSPAVLTDIASNFIVHSDGIFH